MSYLAIGSVTKAIAELLEKKLNKPPLMGTVTLRVTILPPDDDRVEGENGVNLFLYRVVEDPFTKNMDWRGDKANPVGIKRPPLALTLQYLLTAYAKKSADSARDDITAHQLLGNALLILHEHAVLNDIHDSDFDADQNSQFAPELRNSFEKIKITLSPTSMEDFSKIWTGLSKAYRLSVAYDVSLVQIAPISPAPLPAPAIQQTELEVGTFDAPVIASIAPAIGPAGVQATLKGSGFKARGTSTSVSVGDTTLEETDLISITEREIVFTIPEAPLRGPKLAVVVSRNGRTSIPVFYEVSPWINSIQPLRGMTGIPLTIPFEVPAGATVSAEIEGQAVAATPDPQAKTVNVVVPAVIAANGPKPVVLILNDGAPKRSNARFFDVLPTIVSRTVNTVAAPPLTTITVSGQRLSGQSVHVRYGKLLLRVGNSVGDSQSATQVVVNVGRVLSTTQPVSVIVDGRETNIIPPRLDSLDPPEGFVTDEVALIGNSLSGQNVVVHFGAVDVTIGAQAFASQIKMKVPAGVAAGTIQVGVTVDGNNTNTVAFEVLA